MTWRQQTIGVSHLRLLKSAIKDWEMTECQWMFQDNPDVQADVEMILELRIKLSHDTGPMEKIAVAAQFQDLCKNVEGAKDSLAPSNPVQPDCCLL